MTAPRPARPVTQDDYDEVRQLHALGLGRNDIARQLDRSGNVVSRLAAEMGLSFARAGEVAVATEVRRQDLAARRMLLAEHLTTDAERLREQLWQPTVVFAFGGKDNDYNEQPVNEPPPSEKRALLSAAGIAIDRSLKLEPGRDDSGADAARSMVGQLMAGLAEVYREQQSEQPAAEGAGDAP
ncbi:helix-turn-helix domain-containing protein [Kitasatospora viridis]|uniref:Uncharacterized protein n=1 Tax=Kitasatospora viridis TaxID=281105 RepID=A0A561UKN8_9ACTN|nr:helix-turn-helix domain-containing protein [Kitasatospora viridis]TWF99924.1 hypothetical protein FHX73_113784 [Kitasatospora viridis]